MFRQAFVAAALLVLGACSTAQMADSSLNVYGPATDQETRDRVDRLVKFCGRLSESGAHDLANRLCLRAHHLDPSNPLPLMLLADNFQRAGEDEMALRSYQRILLDHPRYTEVSYRLGKLQAVLGQDDEAMATLLDGLAHAPNESRLLNVVGILKDQAGDHGAAQFYYRESLALEPGNLSVQSNLGLSLALTGQGHEAVALLEGVVAKPAAEEVTRNILLLAYRMVRENPIAEAAATEPTGEPESSDTRLLLNPLSGLTSYLSAGMPCWCRVLAAIPP